MTSTTHDPNTCHTTSLPDKRTSDVQKLHCLISRCFPDFLCLAEPDSAAQMDLKTCTILPATGEGETNFVRAQVTSQRGEGVTVIVAVEPEALPTQQMAKKIAGILIQSELTYGRPVLLSVINLSGGRPGIHLETAQLSAVGDIECVRVYFTVWGLAGSRADYYLTRPEPLAWAMAPCMRSTSHTQQELLDAARTRINDAQLTDDLRTALLRFLSPDLDCEPIEEVA
jgi:hypothetical protein